MDSLFNRLITMLRNQRYCNEVKSFKENQEREAAFETHDRGLVEVPVDRIVGSVGRYRDFDRSFKPKAHIRSERYGKILSAMAGGRSMPPVNLYRIKDEYYVVDGNHRVAAAKELGRDTVQARVLEFVSSKRTLENFLYYERSRFEEATGLSEGMEMTEIGQYTHLLEQISDHQAFLQKKPGNCVDFQEAAADWRRTIYLPLVTIVSRGGLLEHFKNRTMADLYSYITYHHWKLTDQERRYGIGLSTLVPKNMEEFRNMMSNLNESEYPEMVREITAIILMNVTGKKEYRIVDKLFELDEVVEVHSVHGSIDIIVKILLRRSLLTSDAETIGDFVHLKIRQIPGVISTQTLIPGYSKIKEPREKEG